MMRVSGLRALAATSCALAKAKKQQPDLAAAPSRAKRAPKVKPTTSTETEQNATAHELLRDPTVRKFLSAVKGGSLDHLLDQHATSAVSAPSTDTVPKTATATPPATDAAASATTLSWDTLGPVTAAVDARMSPWTAPMSFKAPFNVRGGCTFAAHHRRLIEAAAASTTDSPHSFPVRWVGTAFAESFPAPQQDDCSFEAVPLPGYPSVVQTDGTAQSAAAADLRRFEARRTFMPLSAYTEESISLLHQTDPPLSARCGLTGKFFSREEVVDTLLHHAAVRQYKSPFWLPHDHPQLATRYLELKPEERPMIVSVVALVFPGDRLPVTGADEPRALLHPDWVNTKTRRPGMNAFTGAVSENPALRKGRFGKSGWVTLDQLVAARMQIPRESNSSTGFSFSAPDLDGGTFVAVQEMSLFNADQLEKPGRLGLIRDEDRNPSSLFQPLF